MKGWNRHGDEVNLTPQQEECVRALLSREPASLPARGFGWGWSTVLETAVRYDRQSSAGSLDEAT